MTGLRFFAASHVVLFHMVSRMDIALPAALARLADYGPAAVSMFFVLSGFILTYNYLPLQQGFSSRRFWGARLARIVPVYWLALLFVLPLYLAASDVGSLRFWARSGLVASLTQSWFPGHALAWNGPSWSLSVEMFFYAMFPLIVLVVRRVPAMTFLGVALVLWAATTAAHFAVSWDAGRGPVEEVITENSAAFRNYIFPPLRLPEFLLGVAGANAFLSGRRIGEQAAGRLALASGGAVIVLMLVPLPVAPIALIVGAFAPLFLTFIWSLAHGTGIAARLLSTPTAILLGQASYALYLFHLPMWRWWQELGLPAQGAFDALVFFGATVLVSIAVFFAVEEPLRRRLRPRRVRRAPEATPP